ncbi:MAG: hypothetical protein WED09_07120 [Homoserinimonas sp.]
MEPIVDLDALTLQLIGWVQELVELPPLRLDRAATIRLRRPDGSVWDMVTLPVRGVRRL